MEALRGMAIGLMITKRAITTTTPPPVAVPDANGKARRLSKAELHDYIRRVVENYVKQRRIARASVGLAGVATLTLAGFGIHRLNNTSIGKDQ